MSVLSPDQIRDLLLRYVGDALPDWEGQANLRPVLFEQMATYLELLGRWNGRMNLSAVREPEEIVRRHLGESLFAAWYLDPHGSVLDLGSGAGFPGVPIQLWHGERHVTLAESQGKKAAFLREVVRTLGLRTEVWEGRAEELRGLRMFDEVVMRAVDTPDVALRLALDLTRLDVWLLGTKASIRVLPEFARVVSKWDLPGANEAGLYRIRAVPDPGCTGSGLTCSTWNMVQLGCRDKCSYVPRGTRVWICRCCPVQIGSLQR